MRTIERDVGHGVNLLLVSGEVFRAKKEGATPVRASTEGLRRPVVETRNEETRPNGRAPRKCRFHN